MPGDRVLLVYPPSLDFIISFIACLKAGLIAVPVFPPDPLRLNKDLSMFASLVQSCGAKSALTCHLYNYATKMASIKVLPHPISYVILNSSCSPYLRVVWSGPS